MFRKLKAEEIDVRIGNITQYGANLLLYKDARCDMNILDESVGPTNWQRKHEMIDGQLFCNVGIKDGDQWIWKQDVGVESNTEKEKGRASDSFKRACVNWGIGRELYTAPRISIKCKTIKNKYDRYDLDDKYQFYGCYVSKIEYDESGNITTLVIKDKNSRQIYPQSSYNEPKKDEFNPHGRISELQAKTIVDLVKNAGRTVKDFCKYFNINDVTELTQAQYNDAHKMLTGRKEK